MPETTQPMAALIQAQNAPARLSGDSSMNQTTTKSPHDMTVFELQAEIGYLQMILHRKVCGDPCGYTSLPVVPSTVWKPPS